MRDGGVWEGWRGLERGGVSGVRRLVNGSSGKMPDVEHSFMSIHIHVYSNIPCKTSVTFPQIC